MDRSGIAMDFDRCARLLAAVAFSLAVAALGGCGSQRNECWTTGGACGSGSGGGGGRSSNSDAGQGSSGEADAATTDDGRPTVGGWDATISTMDAGGGSSSSSGGAIGTVIYPDCPGCTTFPGPSAPSCANAPPIHVVYPTDTVLVPPNMNVISVQWTPFGSQYSRFSVDFSSAPNTDWHIIAKCANQTIDAQSGSPSGGCEVVVDPVSWSRLAGANRGQGPITITVRGTTNGVCTTTSNPIHLSFAETDLIGTYYYWQSLISTAAQGVGGNGCLTAGVGGYIWKQAFGDITKGETNVTPCPQTINAGCNGCHSLSRDGTRMVVYSDDNDSDDEYTDVAGSYLDMTTTPATMLPGGVTRGGGGGGGQPAGFSTIDPNVTANTTPTASGYYITSNGFPCTTAGGGRCGSSTGYPTPVPANGFSAWNGTNGSFINGVPISPAGMRPTMPDWSPDGKSVVYVVPAGEFTSWRQDDAHVYGGSIYAVPYLGAGMFGTQPPQALVQSNGENNYYPSYSPDVPMSYILFNRVDNMGQGANCAGGFCADDSFSNPAARLMLLGTVAGFTPVDLEKANGSPVTAKVPLSNSYPRWAPFVQTYRGNKLLWFTFSSTRDYGVRVVNQNHSANAPVLQKMGMHQCYPADAAETPGASHGQGFAPDCQEPQLWMAPIFLSEGQATHTDPSGVAFWLPYQKITTHNHTAQWTQEFFSVPPPVDAGVSCTCQSKMYGACGVKNNGCGCCAGNGYCTGNNICFQPPP